MVDGDDKNDIENMEYQHENENHVLIIMKNNPK
jgi:hypothetical protein